eukprot:TRINITY_DN5533_c0_g1_i1.p1 TRINITY_DN5533_c0_g1~~TRINITY_DN5533_c0_g1_i1.p1  ORF type:complete len:387 (+),score=34.69 TRINITY_DN5533_c0_g1_i1:85-1161(+)
MSADDFECAICLCIALNPVTFPCSEQHMFCAACIEGVNVCPMDREEKSGECAPLKGPLRRIYNSMVVSCNGCGWRGHVASLSAHRLNCEDTIRRVEESSSSSSSTSAIDDAEHDIEDEINSAPDTAAHLDIIPKSHSLYQPIVVPSAIQVMNTPGGRLAIRSTVNTLATHVPALAHSGVLRYTAKVCVATVPLVTAVLGVEVAQTMWRWHKGEIKGARCAQIVIEALVGTVGSVAGGAGGALIGTVAGPVGAMVGGLIGSYFGFHASRSIIHERVVKFFELSPSEALDNAYYFLNLPPSCTNEAVNARYRVMALACHPDKGGRNEDWLELNMYLNMIKLARESPQSPPGASSGEETSS